VTTATVETLEHFIGGRYTAGASERTAPIWDPAVGRQQARVVLADAADVDAAVSAARDASRRWAEVSASRRARVMFSFRNLLREHADQLAEVVAREHGKMVDDARGEVTRGIEVVEFACGIPHLSKGEYSDQVSNGVDSLSFRQPLGVCAGITPFNFPVMVPMWMHPIAIASGNAFVLKPSERDPSASNLVAELYAEAGLLDGVFNVVHGDRVAVDALLDHLDVAAISFVGSTGIARSVHERASANGKRVQALGGAKNHAVVMPDADLDFSVDQIVAAAFGSAGQRCMAISVVLAVGDVADPLVARLEAAAREIQVGPSADPRSDMGPVVTADALQRITGYVERGVKAGARPVVDGRFALVPAEGFFIGPTVLDRVETGMDVYTDEIFGPVLCVVRVAGIGDAIETVNANNYANGAAIFTSSGGAARAFQRGVEVGMVGVNVPIPVPMAFHSFGGWKASLFGDAHVHGREGIEFYTRGKVVTSRWPAADGATRQAPTMAFPTPSSS
jgi:malonate-semialdehyde dehydrogenase (acetylating) / methylmalonate-semialdehyde dehydrogenase